MSQQPPALPPDNQPAQPTVLDYLRQALAFLKSAAFRDFSFAVLLIIVEMILAVRYGADTYHRALSEHQLNWPEAPLLAHIALSMLDVLLIDGVFVLMLVIAKYAGQSSKANKLRTFAVLGATAIMFVMIGVATGTMQVIVAARWAGGLLLGYIGGDVLLDTMKRISDWLRQRRANRINKPLTERLLAANLAIGYLLAMIITLPVSLVIGFIAVSADYWHAAQARITLSRSANLQVGKINNPQLAPPSPRQLGGHRLKLDNKALKMLTAWQQDPHLSNPKVGKLVGLSGEGVRQRKARLQRAGVIRIKANGNGKVVEVVQQP